jgi:hypothetical protein
VLAKRRGQRLARRAEEVAANVSRTGCKVGVMVGGGLHGYQINWIIRNNSSSSLTFRDGSTQVPTPELASEIQRFHLNLSQPACACGPDSPQLMLNISS